MRREILLKIIIGISFLIAIGVNIHARRNIATIVPIETELKSIMAEGDSLEKKETPFLYHEVYRNNRLIGYCFNTKDIAPLEKGFSSHIEMLVGIDRVCNIKNLKLLRHNETSTYADGIGGPEFLDQFKGKGPEDRFIVGEDVDGITHATISSKGVSSILKTSLKEIEREILKVRGETATSPLKLDRDFYITVLIITFLLIIFYFKLAKLKYLGLGISITYFGFWKANFISMTNLGSIFLWNLPEATSNLSWYVLIFSGLILTFLLGGFYCSSVCPFGGLQRILKRIVKFNIEITPALANRLRKIKFFLLWLFAVLVLVLNNPNVVNYEPFSTVFLRRGSLVAWMTALIILVLSLFHYRPFCSYFCSAGAFLEIVSSVGRKIFRKRGTK